jgi:hypothetical protein
MPVAAEIGNQTQANDMDSKGEVEIIIIKNEG